MRKNRGATAEEREFLRKHYHDHTAKQLAALLGWSVKKVYNEAFVYGIAKPQVEVNDEFKKMVLTELEGLNKVVAGQVAGCSPGTILKIRNGTHEKRKRWFDE